MHTREFEIVSRGNSRCKIPAIWAGLAVFGLASLTQMAEYRRFLGEKRVFIGGLSLRLPPQPASVRVARQ